MRGARGRRGIARISPGPAIIRGFGALRRSLSIAGGPSARRAGAAPVALAVVLLSVPFGAAAVPVPGGARPAEAAAAAPAEQTRAAPAQPRIRALVISGGPFHDYILQNKLLLEALSKAFPIDWTVLVEGAATNSRVALYEQPDWARGFDIVIHNECYADVSDPAFIRKITAAHRGGVPAMVIHCAMHSYRDAKVDDWREFLGVSTRRHTPQHRIAVKIADPDHPVVNGWKTDWVTPMDELYVIDKVWPTVKPLAAAVNPQNQAEYPLAWVNDYGGTRVFGTTLGHGNDTWADPVFRDLLVRAFKWTIGAPAAGKRD